MCEIRCAAANQETKRHGSCTATDFRTDAKRAVQEKIRASLSRADAAICCYSDAKLLSKTEKAKWYTYAQKVNYY